MDDLPDSGRKAANRDDLQQPLGAAQVLEVVRPQPGELRIIDLDRSTDVSFDFSLEEARIIALDVDIIIAFTDGGKLLLPNLGLLATGLTPPHIRFSGRPVSWERVFSVITDVSIGEATATLTNIGRSSDAGKEDGTPEPKTEALATPQAPQPAPLVRLQSTFAGDLGLQAASLSEPASVRSAPLDIPKPTSLGAGSNTRFADPNSNTGSGYYLLSGLKVDLNIELYNLSKPREYQQNADGSRDIFYAPGGFGSDSSLSYVAQSTSRLPIVASTAENDTLYLDDPKLVPAGYAYRKVVLTLDSQTNGFEVTKVTLSGFPEGVSLVGYSLAAGQYVIPVDLASGGKVEFGLLYALPGPTSNQDSAGFFNYFQLNVTSTAANSKGDYRDLDTIVRFGVREVSSAADMEYANVSGKVNVLWSNPPGAVADGGAGDDTIYSSSGADTITGGAGSDLVSYVNSSGPVTVNLGLRSRSQTYAQGDVFLDDIERLTGSTFADSLLGNASGNFIKTGGGADTVYGAGGSDTVDFSESVSGVTVNLANSTAQKGGDAKGVVLLNIENIIGSATGANSLVGTTGDNYLEGGALNDTFRGEGGFDTFIGAGGTNIVDFSTAGHGMSIDLTTSVVIFQDIARIIGSNFGDTFAGDATDNYIIGGTGNDSVVGRGGSDTVVGNAGDDTFRDSSGSDSYSGGAGNDKFLSGAAYQPRSDYDGGDGFDTLDFSDFNPGSGKLTMTLFPDGSGRFAWDGTAATGEFTNMEALFGSRFVDNLVSGNDTINHLVGGAGSDSLVGAAGADTIEGGGGNDSLAGGGDAGDTVDYIAATAGLDVTMTPGAYTAHVGTGETDTLSGFVNVLGSNFDDRIYGDSQSSVLSGADGNDTISPGLGDDTVDGGRGTDVLDLTYLGTQAVSLALSSSFALLPTGQSLLGLNMEGVLGASGDDTFQADAQNAGYIGGAAGNDLLVATGSGGGATFEGGADTDTLDYSQVAQAISVNLSAASAATLSLNGVADAVLNIETLIAGSLNDTIAAIDDTVAHRFLGNAGDDSLTGGAVSDSLVGGIGNDTLAGGLGNDLLDAGDGADSVFGGAGADTLLDTAGNDSLDGGDGAIDEISYADRTLGISVAFNSASVATLVVSASETDQIVNLENITGGTGDDTIWAAGDADAHRLLGLDGADSLAGGLGADTLIGGAGSDTLASSAGVNDSIDGGADVDRLDYTLTSGGLTATFSGAGAGAVTTSGKTDTFANIEIFVGSAGDDSIVGLTADDTILGSAGADTVFAGLGNDSLDGGDSGGDLVSYAGTALAISVNFASANVASVSIAGGEVDTIVNFENVIAGTGNDTLSAAGDTATHSFSGDAGNDSLIGGVADDTLSAGAGADTLVGGLGNDRFDGGDGLADVVSYEARSEAISVAFVSGTTVTVNVGTSEVDTIINVENATGGSGNDTLSAIGDATSYTLTGNAGADSLAGGSGADMVLGGTGADTFASSDGNDTMDGGDDVDRLSFASQAGPVQIVANGGGLFKATLFGSGGITTVGLQDLRNFEWITGTSLNDSLVAFSDANTLDGGAGHDSILGTAAGDSLFGAAGNDTIVATGVGDTVEGGAGSDSLSGDQNDVLNYASGTGVSIDVQAGRALETSGTTDSVSGFDHVVGSSTASNTFFGDDDANTLVGGAANDYFVGRLGNDSFVGGGGSDTLDYGTRTLGLVATLGATGSIVLSAGETDRFAGITQFTFSSGADSIVSGATADSVFADDGNDSFIANGGAADTVDAGSGSDYLSYANSAFSSVTATLTGAGLTAATVTLAAGGVRQDSLVNFEAVIGSSGDDSFLGDDANNQTFLGSAGSDTFDGGAGGLDYADYYGVPGATSMVVDMLGANQSAVLYGAGGVVLKVDRLINIEGIRSAGSGNSSLFGDNFGNALTGGDGTDSLVGRSGSDTISGGLGNDSMFGNTTGTVADAGDVLDYSYTNNVTTPVYGLTYDMAAATTGVLVTVGLGDIDFVGRFRNVIGSRGDDSIVTDSFANSVDLGVGNDTVTGGEAGDSFTGGTGNDVLDYSSATGDIIVTLAGAAAITVTVAGAASGVAADFEGFVGGAGNDLLAGDAGANIIAGGAGADTLILNDGHDSAFGGTDNDSVLGGAGNDTLAGGDGVDTILGGADNDCISGGLGNDSLEGGTGNDALSYGDAQAGVTVALTGTTVTTTVSIGAERDIVANFEIFVGSTFADSILGSAADETLAGGDGADTLVAGGGSNSLAGGAGNDLLFVDVSAGNDTFDGGDGVDTIDFSQFTTGVSVRLGEVGEATTVYAGARTITLLNFENITSGTGNDTLVGNSGDNIFDAGAGDDCLIGNAGSDTIYGEAGADTLRGGTGTDQIDPGAGPGDLIDNSDLTGGINRVILPSSPFYTGTGYADTMVGGADTAGATIDFTLIGGVGDDCLTGNDLDDSLIGGDGNDTLLGVGGNDTLDGGIGDDYLDGGTGTADEATYATRTVGINATFATGTVSTLIIDPATGETDRIINVENITGGSGNDTISAAGDAVAHVLRGGAGDDCLTGGSGDDTLYAGAGRDNLSGGLGNDLFIAGAVNQTLDGGDGTDVVDLSGFSGVSMVLGGNGSDLSVALPGGGFLQLVNIENIIAGAGADTLVGNSSPNSIIGDGGDDSIFGNTSNDTLLGGTGNDTLYGGGGNDSLDGGTDVSDFVSYGTQSGGISAVFAASGTLTIAAGATDTDIAINVENLAGSTGADTISALDSAAHILSGLDGADTITGGSGADTLLGGAGSDTLVGGLGNDLLDGGDALDDALSYETRSSGVSVAFTSGSTANVSVAAGETDQIINIENIFGGTGSDTLSGAGDSVAHLLSGGTGNDSLQGGSGADTLLGGAGNDTVLASFGTDSLDGGAGNDLISYAGLSATQSVSMAFDGTSTILATLFDAGVSVGLATLVNFEVFTGGAANDTLVGDNVADTLDGGAGDDSLAGFGGADTLIGGLGNDTLRGGLGNDSLDGGAGTMDFASFEDATAAVNLVLAANAVVSSAAITGGELERVINIENLLGGAFNDTLAAAAADTTAHMFLGASGNDSLFGGAANDTLDGGDGNDALNGGAGANSLSGGLGNDTILGGTGADTIDGGDGNDTINGGTGLDSLMGGAGNDSIIGTASAETISGGDGDDAISSVGGADNVTGGLGNDSLLGSAAAETLSGDDGDDTITGGGGLDSLTGGLGNDLLTGGAAADTITGGAGDDTIVTGGGADSVSGDAGADSIFGTAAAETLTGGEGNDSINGGGGAGADSLVGGLGDELITGGTGADTLEGGLGNDTLDGGAGTADVAGYTYSGAPTTLIASGQSVAGGHSFSITGGVSDIDTLINIETLRLGTASTTVDLSQLTSASFGLRVDGSLGTGNDSILGSGGADSLLGGANADTLAGGVGLDTLSGGAGTDFADYSYLTTTTNTFTLTRTSDVAFLGTAAVGTDVDSLLNIEIVKLGFGVNSVGLSGMTTSITIDGSQGAADSIATGTGADSILGGAGNDTFASGTGNDTIVGDGGDDRYIATATTALIVEGATGGTDTVQTALTTFALASTATLYNGAASGFVENLVYTGAGAFSGTGNELDNSLMGNTGADTLLGGLGNDTLNGGAGAADVVSYNYTGAPTTLVASNQSLTGGFNTFNITGSGETDLLINAEILRLGAASTTVDLSALASSGTVLTVDGSLGTGADSLLGSAGADCLIGGAGADTLAGGVGNDTLSGGAGNDFVDYAYLTAPGNTFTLTRTSDTAWLGTAAVGTDVDSLINIETIRLGAGVNSVGLSGQTIGVMIDGRLGASDSIATGAGADTLLGGLGADTFSGGAGNDSIDGDGGSDVASYAYTATGISLVLGTSVSVTVTATDIDTLINIENVIGGSGADTIQGDANDNTIFGGAGNDRLLASLGNDTFDGGANTDAVDFSLVTAQGYNQNYIGSGLVNGITAYTFTLTKGATTFTDVLWNVESISGLNLVPAGSTTGISVNLSSLPFNVGVGGTIYADTLIGGTGQDTLQGGLGNDSLDGGNFGNNVLNYVDYSYITDPSTAISAVMGGTTNPTGTVTTLLNGVSTGEVDTLVNAQGVIGGAGNDSISLSTTVSLIYSPVAVIGGGGDDYISLLFTNNSYGNVIVDGGVGNNTFATGSGTVTQTINLNAGTMVGNATGTIVNIRNVVTAGGADCITGDGENNSISSGSFNDTIAGGLGNDTLDGGTNTDVVDYSYATNGISAVLGTTTTLSVAANDIDRLVNVEGVLATAFNDTIVGSNTAGYFDGRAGDDTLLGGSAADTIVGGLGNDTMDGGAGSDVADYSYLASTRTVSVTATNSTTWVATSSDTLGAFGADVDRLLNFEIFSPGATNARGDFSASTVAVNWRMSLGNNTFIGGSGADNVTGWNAGNGTIDGGAGNDVFNSATTPGSSGNAYGASTLIMTGPSAGQLIGGAWNNINANNVSVSLVNFETIFFGANNDKYIGAASTTSISLSGGIGADTLDDGGGTSETLIGGSGADTFYVRNLTTQVTDQIDGSTNTINTTLTSVDLSTAQYGAGFVQNLNYLDAAGSVYTSTGPGTGTWGSTIGSGNFTGIGSDFNNVITGGSGNNSLVGASGNDTLVGNNGNDYLKGGGGNEGVNLYPVASISELGAGWAKNNATSTLNQIAGPTGLDSGTNADYLSTTTPAGNFTYVATPVTAGTTYQVTFYAKAVGATSWVQLGTSNGFDVTNTWINFDLVNGVIGNKGLAVTAANYSITAVNSGWYAITLTSTATGTGANGLMWLEVLDSNVATRFGWGGSLVNQTVALWGESMQVVGMDDSVFGGAGADTLQGGAGSDTMDGGSGGMDVADYSYLSTNLSLNLSNFNTAAYQTVTLATGDVDQVRNFEGLIGGSGADTLTGDSADNYLGGGAGVDSLLGGLGNDTISGGAGNDRLDADGGTNDVADYSYATSGVTVTLDASGGANVSVGATDQDTLFNFEGVIGGSGNDMLIGNSSANFLSGGLGDDTLWGGGAGADTLFGGGGNDVMRFTRSDLTGMSFDGGADTDTLNFELSGSFTGAQLSAAITGVEILDFTRSGAAINATLTSADVQALGLSALNRDLTIRTDGNDAISLNGSMLTAGNDYFVNPGDAGASVVLHVISSAST